MNESKKAKSNIIELPEPNYFGDCPRCGRTDGFLNIGRAHWFVCHRHRLRWCAGSNHFACWREESPSDWKNNAMRIGHYREVEPWYRDRDANGPEPEGSQ